MKSTSEITRSLKSAGVKSFSMTVALIKEMGFTPTFESAHAVYWNDDDAEKAKEMILEGKTAVKKTMETKPSQGISLRDYFAAKAMQGMLSSPDSAGVALIAEWAYRQADAMLVERAKP